MIRLKSLTLQSRVIQSPMAGCTDLAFRLIAREHAMEFAFLEMISSEALIRKKEATFDLMRTVEKDRPLGAQIVGSNPDVMADAAQMIEEMGFDLVDINCGCPVPKIVSPGGGSALLIEPEKSRKIFRSVVKRINKIPVTIKMRKGFRDESGDEAVRIAKIAQDEGISAVAVHGRTRVQGYSGFADWEAIRKVKEAVTIPVFGNGDVFDGRDAKKLIEVSGCDAVMIGRGALGNPWIYDQIHKALAGDSVPAGPTLDQKKATALQHLTYKIETDGERKAVLEFRKIASWYFKDFPGASGLRAKINCIVTADEMRETITAFQVIPPTRIPRQEFG